MPVTEADDTTSGSAIDWIAPIVADAEAGFGGPLNAYELMSAMIDAGAAGVHFEDQLASEKKCGHMGGKVLVPTSQHIRTLNAARLAADVADVPTVIIARTDSLAANLLTSDIDERDAPFLTGERTADGFYETTGRASRPSSAADSPSRRTPTCSGWKAACRISTWLAPSPRPSIANFPGKQLAYNCSPSFNWKKALDDAPDW